MPATSPLHGVSTVNFFAADHAAAKKWYTELLEGVSNRSYVLIVFRFEPASPKAWKTPGLSMVRWGKG